jgi:GNAT superfamily N-acetyltransferase
MRDDVPRIVELLADDDFGAERESPPDPDVDARYWRAFDSIDADERHLLLVGEADGRVVATLQLSFLPSLTLRGTERAQLEGVRVDRSLRGGGVGRQLIEHALDIARDRGCGLVQLTTNKARTDAHRFYESLGFEATHEGMKLSL